MIEYLRRALLPGHNPIGFGPADFLLIGLAALLVLVVASTAGGASKAGTLVFAGASDPTYLDPALVSDGESFRVTEQMFEGLVKLKPGTTKIVPALATEPRSDPEARRRLSGPRDGLHRSGPVLQRSLRAGDGTGRRHTVHERVLRRLR